MVICFDASLEAKRALDALLATGQFRDTSEAVSMALVNYQVIHHTVSQTGEMILERNPAHTVQRTTSNEPTAATASQASPQQVSVAATVIRSDIPPLFRLQTPNLEGLTLLPVPAIPEGVTNTLPPARWLFGQYNKLLPVKAACRALLNLQRGTPSGLSPSEAASGIASTACDLGDYLQEFDKRHDFRREEAFAAAFPSSSTGKEGSRLRFGNQFVAGLGQGRLEGLPAALRFAALDEAKEPRLCLTRAGAEFAVLENPVLDGQTDVPVSKFNADEISFLLTHIRQYVPEEISAMEALIQAIEQGSNTPDAIDAWLRQHFKLPSEKDIKNTFLTTQRTGAISRLVDLGLVAREKTGLRVTYLVTQVGRQFRGQSN